MRVSSEVPTILVVQARSSFHANIAEQQIVRRIAEQAPAEVLFANPLLSTGRNWRNGRVLGGIDGVVWMGTSTIDHTHRTYLQERFEEFAFPVMEQALDRHELPNFGICHGAQTMARVAGGEVARADTQSETGTAELTFTSDAYEYGMLRELPQPYALLLGHKDSVVRLPQDATVLAVTPRDPHAIWTLPGNNIAVQGHPEQRDATGLRKAIELSQTSELGPYVQTYPLQDTPEAPRLLVEFMRRCRLKRTDDIFRHASYY